MHAIRVLLMAGCLGTLAVAQTPVPPTPTPSVTLTGPATAAQHPAKPRALPPATPSLPRPAVPQPGLLSHEEQVELENIMLKSTLLNRDYNDLVQKILAEHPGYLWNAATNSLIPPAAPPPPAK